MKYFYLCVIIMLLSLICVAEERSAEVSINVIEDEKISILGTPWVWIGTFIFIYLFLEVTRGGGVKGHKP